MIPASLRALLAAGLAVFATGGVSGQSLDNPGSAFDLDGADVNWINTVERTERGHLMGKPEAEAALIEFISYTCGHCASFAMQSGPTLDLVGIGPGKISVEVRPVIRNGLDLALTLLAQCGDPGGFKNRHRLLLYSQRTWLPKAFDAPQSQRDAWERADAAARLNAAQALDLDDMLAAQGMPMPQINACLADDKAAEAILANDAADRTEFGIEGTPSFALDGNTLPDVYSWPDLAAVLQARFAPGSQNNALPASAH
jgi:protein-disulfide isomerase